MLTLPFGAPSFALRLELGWPPIELFIPDHTLKSIEKMLRLPDNRCPKICNEKLRKINRKFSQTFKHCWTNQIKEFFEAEEEELW